jgi:hypothetical protein
MSRWSITGIAGRVKGEKALNRAMNKQKGQERELWDERDRQREALTAT